MRMDATTREAVVKMQAAAEYWARQARMERDREYGGLPRSIALMQERARYWAGQAMYYVADDQRAVKDGSFLYR